MALDFAAVLIFLSLGAILVFAALATAWFFRPNNPSADKLSTYECGERPVGSSWIQFHNRFYIIALIFIIFDVEVMLLYPWAVVFKKLGFLAFIEMTIFVGILLVGLAYVWAKGDLEWIKDTKAR
jgi:NADH-quinone oxidoreductase subunit A